MTELSDQALLRYSRHILLPEIDITGQERLLTSRALIVGAGGLGSPVALYLASAGVGQITIADNDTVELSNLQRQIVHDNDSLAMNKAQSAARHMHRLNPDIQIQTLTERLDSNRLRQLAADHDLVLDCCDNFATRHAINAACVETGVPLVSGAAVRFSGQLAVYDTRDPGSPCYACVFPADGEATDGPCATFGVLSPLVGVIGSLQAVEAIKLLAGIPAQPGWLTMYDALSGEFNRIQMPRDGQCPTCAQHR